MNGTDLPTRQKMGVWKNPGLVGRSWQLSREHRRTVIERFAAAMDGSSA